MRKFSARSARAEHHFRLTPAPTLFRDAGVLRSAKLGTQSFRPVFANKKPMGDADKRHHLDSGYYGYWCRVHGVPLGC